MTRHRTARAAAVALLPLLAGTMMVTAPRAEASVLPPGATEKVSVDSTEISGDADSSNRPALSTDGNVIAFASAATNLVPDDTNGLQDIFVRDLTTGTTERVNVSSTGEQAIGGASTSNPDISGDGRFVVFASAANNLIAGDTNNRTDLFVKDRATESVERVNIDENGAVISGTTTQVFAIRAFISADGRFVAFSLPGSGTQASRIYVRDRQTQTTEIVTVQPDGTPIPRLTTTTPAHVVKAMSSDGRYVLFTSTSALVTANDTDTTLNLFVRDLVTDTTELVDVSSDEAHADAAVSAGNADISADGNRIVFASAATNLVASDTNGVTDVFVRDRSAGTTERLSLDSSGTEVDAASDEPAISDDGTLVAFLTAATLVPGDTNLPSDTNTGEDAYVRNLGTDTTTLESVSSTGAPGTGNSIWVNISPDGSTLGFVSNAPDLVVPNDPDALYDVFVHSLLEAPVAVADAYATDEDTVLSVPAPGVLANDTDADTEPGSLTAGSASDPAGGSVTLNANGSFTYTPDTNFAGTDTFTYTVSDGTGGTDTGTVAITVTGAADAPVAVDDAYTTGEDTVLTVAAPGVVGNDTDGDGNTLTAGSASTPTNGTVTLAPNGGFVYTPNPNFSGTDTFTYTVSDGTGLSDTGLVTITVTATNGSAFHPMTPTRILDSRAAPATIGPYNTPWAPGVTRDVTVTGGSVPVGADAVTLNVTVTNTTAAGFLTIWPKGQGQPVASNLNWAAGQTIPNAVTVKVGAGGQVSVANPFGSTHVIIDIVGYYDGQPGDGYTPLDPARILDSRTPATAADPFSTPWGPGTTREVTVTGAAGVPANADAVVLNATVTRTSANGFLTIWPNGQAQPNASSLNWAPGQTIPNAVTVKVGAGGQVSVFNQFGNADVIFDVVGYFAPGSGHLFHPLNPARIVDSRQTAPNQVGPYATAWPAATNRDVQVSGNGGVPAGAAAALLNVTVTGGTATSYLSIWPAGQPAPVVSSLNWDPGVTIPNSVTTKLNPTGAITIRNEAGTVHVIADTNGWYG